MSHVDSILETWARDFKLAARSLTRTPMFTLVIVVTLTLAIGANTAIFSVVKPVLLEPLPYPNADRLVNIAGYAPGTEQPELGVPDEVYFEWRASVRAIEDGGLYATGMTTTRVEGRVEQQFGTRATASFFTTLGARVLHGRLPTEEDGTDVVVLSHWMWESWFGSNPDVVGRSYTFARGARTVIGVMVPEFRFPDERVAYWSPWPLRASQVAPGGFGANMIARIAPGTDRETLVAQLAPVPRRVQARLGGSPSYAGIMQRYGPVVTPLREHLVGKISTPLWILLGTVGIVFLVACANLANLFMVRAESRRRDFAVRRAHGAGRADLVRLQMAEALALAGTGGAGGILLAWACVPLLIRAAPDAVAGGIQSTPIPGLASAGLDITALLFTGAMCVLAACAFGLLPAIRFSSGQLGSLRQAGSVGRIAFTREALVVLQTASAVALLVGSGLLVRSFWKLSRVDPGYDTSGILTFQIAPDR
ncbi:MAG: ABC transporter permease, partial [Longimicrobiales bacterium]